MTANSNDTGFTLLEAMIAILLLASITLWTMQGMLTAYKFTSRNQIRDEAVRLAEEILTDLRNTPFASLSAGTLPNLNISRQINNYDQSYTIDRNVTSQVPGLAYSVDVVVNWAFHGIDYNYSASTIIADK